MMLDRIVIDASSITPQIVFTDADMKASDIILNSSLSGEELAIDEARITAYSDIYIKGGFYTVDAKQLVTADGNEFYVTRSSAFPDRVPYGTALRYYRDGIFIGKFYVKSCRRITQTDFIITAQSPVGVLDSQTHYGGIYNGVAFKNMIAEIVGSKFKYTIADDLKDVLCYGWLPIDTRRNNLHQVIFAVGAAIHKDKNGDMLFAYPDTDASANIPENRVFYGGFIDYRSPSNRVEVTEHTFVSLPSDTQKTLFDNTQSGAEAAVNTVVNFPAPMHDITVSGSLTIAESGVNYAVINGVGVLAGKEYTHTRKVISRTVSAGNAENVAKVENATMVNPANSENVADRMMSYYSAAKNINADIVLEEEKVGDLVNVVNPFGEPENAFLSQMQLNSSSFIRASCEMITGYAPSGGGNNYTERIVLTGNGTWTAPKSGKIRVALIGGGQGGSGGYCGTDGSCVDVEIDVEHGDLTVYHKNGKDGEKFSLAGKGGLRGEHGRGGNVYITTLNVTAGQKFSFSCGAGGKGGVGEKILSTEYEYEYTEDRYHPKKWLYVSNGYYADDIEGNKRGNQVKAVDGHWTHTFSEAQQGEEGQPTTFGSLTSEDGASNIYGFTDILSGESFAVDGNDGMDGADGYHGGYDFTDDGEGRNSGKAVAGDFYRPNSGNEKRYGQYWKAGGGQGGNATGRDGDAGETHTEGRLNTTDANWDNEYPYSARGGNGATPVTPSKELVIGKGGTAGSGAGGGGGYGAFKHYINGAWIDFGVDFKCRGGISGNGGDAGDGADGGIIIYM